MMVQASTKILQNCLFIPYNQWGGSDWENKLSVEYKNGMFSIKDSNWDDIGVSWFDSRYRIIHS